MNSAVVFAYHNVGVRCLKVLLDQGVDVRLVVTHKDNPQETIWFESVAKVAADYDIPVVTPDDPNDAELLQRLISIKPEFLFSFYYRHMLKADLLAVPSKGAFNMHGSLLPKYRGRVPTNWAVIHGERETGATLHVMNEKPDNGAIVDQMSVPILRDDTAQEVFDKVVVAAEQVLLRAVPGLLAGSTVLKPQDLSQGGYFGGRKPEDGRIRADFTGEQMHNFVRALTHPYPGAFFDVQGKRVVIWKTRLMSATVKDAIPGCVVVCDNHVLYIHTQDGGWVRILAAECDGVPLNADNFVSLLGSEPVLIG